MHMRLTTPASHLANAFDVRSVMHGQVRLTAVNLICVTHESMKGLLRKCKYRRISVSNDVTLLLFSKSGRSSLHHLQFVDVALNVRIPNIEKITLIWVSPSNL